ncbi:hypothetical protein ACJX0J_024317, partial [Zea mays]
RMQSYTNCGYGEYETFAKHDTKDNICQSIKKFSLKNTIKIKLYWVAAQAHSGFEIGAARD